MSDLRSITRLAEFAHRLSLDDLPPGAAHHAVRTIRDTIGVAVSGSRRPENAALGALTPSLGASGPCTVIGQPTGVSAHTAAFANAASTVTLELDEGNQFAINHPSVHVLFAALAVAEDTGASGRALVQAFVAGYEVAVRVGSVFRLRDAVHPFGTAMITGAAVAAGLLRGFSPDELAEAIRVAAGLTPASSQSSANSGASVRNLNTGMTAHGGVLATDLVRAGHTGEPDALSRVYGAVLGDGSFDLDRLDAYTLDDLFITRNYVKFYACSRWNHAPIEAMEAIRRDPAFDAGLIERIDVFTYDPATRLSGQHPQNGYAAKHSIPFNVAVRALWGRNDVDVYTDGNVADPSLVDLTGRTSVHEDPSMTALLPGVRAGRVAVTLTNGTVIDHRIDTVYGNFDNPASEADLEAKFRALTGAHVTEAETTRLWEACDDILNVASLATLTSLLRIAS